MQWLKRIFGSPSKPPEASRMVNGFPAPWVELRPSIYSYLAEIELDSHGRLPQGSSDLPDEEIFQSRHGGKIRWAAGAMDGVFGHHTNLENGSTDELLRLLVIASNTRSPEHVKYFYDQICDQNQVTHIDQLLGAVRASKDIQADSLHSFSQWLVRESPDRASVKIGIALLGLLLPARDTETLMLLGLHDEFTLYVAVALKNTLPSEEGENALWSLARKVDGWGRIHLVERLCKSNRADIKAWLLREGYKNSVMHEYLAYACAVGGELLEALKPDSVDDELLNGAGDLIQALISGGPAEGIESYIDSAKVIQRYLEHTAKRESAPLDAYLVVSDIARFTQDEGRDWSALEIMGWTVNQKMVVAELASSVLVKPNWQLLVLENIEAEDRVKFWNAATAAERMGLDIWEKRLERQRAGLGDQWFDLMRSREPDRIDQVIDLALKQIDLASIATGPGNDLGLGADFQKHSALDFILQELGDFPGKGWPLVEAGLQSSVIRNRNLALKTLEAWGPSQWPEGTTHLLSNAHCMEPLEDVRARLAKLLAVAP